MFKFEIGIEVKDVVTGFKGRITGRTDYITGCNVYMVQPELKADGTFVDARWLDEPRLEVISDLNPLRLQQPAGEPRGADLPAPIK